MIDRNEFLKQIILREFGALKKVNHRYSLRLFAQRIGVSSGALTDFLNGKRSFSVSMVLRIAKNLQLPDEEKSLLVNPLSLHDQSELSYHQTLSLTKEGTTEVLEMVMQVGRKIRQLSSHNRGDIPVVLQLSCKLIAKEET